MAVKRRMQGRAMSMPAGVGLGAAVSLIITVLGAMILAWMVVTERVEQSSIGYGCMVILPCASMLGCLVANCLIRHRRLMVSLITCAGFYMTLIAIALAFGSGFDGMIVTALMILLGGGIAQIPALIGSRGGVRRHKISAYR